MPPALATFLTIVGVLFLLRWEVRCADARSPALWIPVLWMSITGSRFVSDWMQLGRPGSASYYEGSPIDAAYFAALIAAAIAILVRRDVKLWDVIRSNAWIAVLFFYMFLSIAWSEYPLIAAKRWVKTLGHPLIALVILTDPNPAAALRTVLRRCAFFLLPVSVLFIKYLPEYGRGFDAWTGQAFNNGVGLTKNDLGYVCMIMGIAFTWMLLDARRIADRHARRIEIGLCLTFMYMVVWLLQVSDSKTSLATLALGAASMLLLGAPFVSKRRFGTYAVVVLLLVLLLEWSFDFYANVIAMLGRDPSLTDRTLIWEDVLALQKRPVFGYGFESFWLGDRLDMLWSKWPSQPTQAHNGYIETYLSLGFAGLALLGLMLLATFQRISRQLPTDFSFARLRMALLLAIVVFNYTEAAFKAVHLVWTVFHLIAMEAPRRRPGVAA